MKKLHEYCVPLIWGCNGLVNAHSLFWSGRAFSTSSVLNVIIVLGFSI